MKKLIIFSLILVGISVIGEIILPRVITQTFYLAGSAPGNPPVTMPHWLLEVWIPRYNATIAIFFLGLAVYVFFPSLKKRRKTGSN